MPRGRLSKLDRVFFVWLAAIGAFAAVGLAVGLLARGDQCGGYLVLLGLLYVLGVGIRRRARWLASLADGVPPASHEPPPAPRPRRMFWRRQQDVEPSPEQRELARIASRWSGVERVFFTWLKVIGTLAVAGTVLGLAFRGECLTAFLLATALMFVLGVGPFRLGRRAGAAP